MCGRILYDAFGKLAERHNFPRDFPSPEVATSVASMLIGAPGFWGVVAEEAGRLRQNAGMEAVVGDLRQRRDVNTSHRARALQTTVLVANVAGHPHWQ